MKSTMMLYLYRLLGYRRPLTTFSNNKTHMRPYKSTEPYTRPDKLDIKIIRLKKCFWWKTFFGVIQTCAVKVDLKILSSYTQLLQLPMDALIGRLSLSYVTFDRWYTLQGSYIRSFFVVVGMVLFMYSWWRGLWTSYVSLPHPGSAHL